MWLIKSIKTRGLRLLWCVISVGTMAGCATIKPPDFIAPGFSTGAVDQIALLPVIDNRVDKSTKLKLDDWILPMAEKSLDEKGYAYSLYNDQSLVSGITLDALEAKDPDFIAKVGPSSTRWVLLFVLEDSSSKLTFGSTGTAEMSGYLFDKKSKKLCWRDKEVSQVGQGGLIGMLMKGGMEESAIEAAARSILQTLPLHVKKTAGRDENRKTYASNEL